LLVAIISTNSPFLLAWGADGHRVVGDLALDRLSAPARRALFKITGTSNRPEIIEWCIWPDAYRSTDEGAWTAPLHFVNIPPQADGYDSARDCDGGLCVTEAIGQFAAELGNAALPAQQRLEAFGFVCHFVADLSQPLHAGFENDRGGNDFLITYNGQQQNLHRFWDSTLILQHAYRWEWLSKVVGRTYAPNPGKPWTQDMTVDWTNDAHGIAATLAYPESPVISQAFEARSWSLVQWQLAKGGRNLAEVLNTVLDEP